MARFICLMSDTFRYDYLGCLRMKDIKTPELDEFTEDSLFFSNYYVSSFPTIPCRDDLFCGRYSFPYHGWQPLEKEALVMAEIFRSKGYLTQLIADTPHLMGRGYNYNRGFTGYYWIRGQESDMPFTHCNYEIKRMTPLEKTRQHPVLSRIDPVHFGGYTSDDIHNWVNRDWRWEEDRFVARTARTASKWIEENYKLDNFLLWIDFFDPHEPWDPPEYLVDIYDPDYTGIPMTHPNYGSARFYTEKELKNLQAHYAAEASLVSKWIGYLIHKIKDVGIYEDSMIIFMSDHGMYLGEHERTGKSGVKGSDIPGPWPLYQEITHIPLIIHAPKIEKGRICNKLVQPPDLLPTLLDLAKIRNPGTTQGHSLASLLMEENNDWPRRYAFSSQGPLGENVQGNQPWTTVTDQNWTFLIGGSKAEKPQLYNIKDDPEEKNNLYGKRPKIENEMSQALMKFLKFMDIDDSKLRSIRRKIKDSD